MRKAECFFRQNDRRNIKLTQWRRRVAATNKKQKNGNSGGLPKLPLLLIEVTF